LRLVARGYTDRKIGDALNISEHTVRSHLKNLYRKLDVSSKPEAVSLAITKRIVELDL
jgi:DNA-binding CsgD family transcriptional regulator